MPILAHHAVVLLGSWLFVLNRYLWHPFIEVDYLPNFGIRALKDTGTSRLPVGITTTWLAGSTMCIHRIF